MKLFFNSDGGIVDFMKIKGKPVVQLQSPKLVEDLTFAVDIYDHLNNLS